MTEPIFPYGGLMPHGHCYLWNPNLIFLHVVSDSLIGISYTSIPFTLAYFVRKRRDLPFSFMFLCFGMFIVACGATHYMEVWTLWTPLYWLSGTIKAMTAAVSVPTAILLVRLVPQALALPSPAQLRRAENTFRELLESAPDAMVIADARGRVVLVNAQLERLFGYSREELLGGPVDVLLPDRFREAHGGHRDGYFESPSARAMGSNLELLGRRKNGGEFSVEISLSPIMMETGRVVSATIRDVSERKAIEAALVNANHELESFSYSAAHDLRAPLRAMNGFAQLLLSGYADRLDDEGKDWLEEILSNSHRMAALIDALLGLSRVARVAPRPTRVDVHAVVRDIVARLAKEEPERVVDVVVGPELAVDADPELIRALFDNLLGNAWKFTRQSAAPRIEIGSIDERGDKAFFVKDNGVGFDMNFASKLFVPFQRLHAARDYPGTGIGLATVQRIVHRHGGRIWADSAPGNGAAFYFTLPLRRNREPT